MSGRLWTLLPPSRPNQQFYLIAFWIAISLLLNLFQLIIIYYISILCIKVEKTIIVQLFRNLSRYPAAKQRHMQIPVRPVQLLVFHVYKWTKDHYNALRCYTQILLMFRDFTLVNTKPQQ